MLPTDYQPGRAKPGRRAQVPAQRHDPAAAERPPASTPPEPPPASVPAAAERPPASAPPERPPASAAAVRDEPGERARSLPAVVAATHRAVLHELAGPTAESGYLAIARLSGHLAAMRRAVCSPLRKRPGAPRELIAHCCTQGRHAEWSLWLLQGRLSGDMLASSVTLDSVYAQLGQQLTGYTAGEGALLAWMEEKLPAADRDCLTAGYLACLAHGPTRPHPRGPRTGPGFRMAFAFHSGWDRWLDGVDGRPRIAPILTVRF